MILAPFIGIGLAYLVIANTNRFITCATAATILEVEVVSCYSQSPIFQSDDVCLLRTTNGTILGEVSSVQVSNNVTYNVVCE